jgi:WD40 repeat protein
MTHPKRLILRATVLIAGLLGLTLTALCAEESSEPRVIWSTHASVPRFTFTGEWQTMGAPTLIEWSHDGSSVVSFSGSTFDRWMRVQDTSGKLEQDSPLPSPWTLHEIINRHEIIMPGDSRVGIAFSVNDVVTGAVIFQERDPAPAEPGTGSGTVRFAMSGDKSVLLVGYGFPRGGQPVSFYDTRDWRKLATMNVPAPGPTGVGEIKLSNAGKVFAFASSHGLVVVDTQSGTVLRTLPVQSADFAFNSDGSMLAVAVLDELSRGERSGVQSVQVFRLSDGAEQASWSPRQDTSYLGNICWDPLGRFLVFVDDRAVVHVWSPTLGMTEDMTIQLQKFPGGLALSPDGKRLTVGDGNVIDFFQIGG